MTNLVPMPSILSYDQTKEKNDYIHELNYKQSAKNRLTRRQKKEHKLAYSHEKKTIFLI